MAKQPVSVDMYYDGAWHDATYAEEVYTRTPITISHGKQDEASQTTPDNAGLTLKSVGGKYNPSNPASVLYGKIGPNTPVRVRMDEADHRAHVEATSWKPGRAIKGDSWTTLSGYGTLSRLAQAEPPQESAIHRFIMANSPLAYWPMEDGRDATEGKPVVGDATMRTVFLPASESAAEWGNGTMAPWLPPALGIRGSIIASTAPPAVASPTAWTLDVMHRARAGTGAASGITLFAAGQVGNILVEYGIVANWNSGSPTLDLYRADTGAAAVTMDSATSTEAQAGFDDRPHHWRLALAQDGADVDVTVYLDGVSIMSATHASSTLQSRPEVFIQDANTEAAAWQYAAMWQGSAPAVAAAAEAAFGHTGELAADRFERLCDEEDIPKSVTGADTPAMGPQHYDTFVGRLAEIEATDGGVIHDARGFLGLTMRTGRSLYNQTPALELDFDAAHISPPFDPVVDDLNTRNVITVKRRSGGQATATKTTGPRNVSRPEDDPQGVGRYPHQVDVNTSTDAVLNDLAQWHLHLGTLDDIRWPSVTVDLVANPDLADAVSAVDVGDRVTVDNPPTDYTPDMVDLVVVGTAETIGSHSRQVTFNTVPARLWEVYQVENGTGNRSRIPAREGDSTLTAAVSNSATSLSVATASGALWTTTDEPFDIVIGGERMTATVVTGASSPQAFTVTRSSNGVVKTHAVGATVQLFRPPVVANTL